tara:strand:- start:3319 stop:4347 length:1029 start_codon:yes stop_codon:yes gene_type:complete
MKITHIYYSLNYGGIETLLINIANWQVKNGYEVTILLINKTHEKDLIEMLDKKVNVIQLNKRFKIEKVNIFLKLNFYLLRNKYDILHIHAAEIANLVQPILKSKTILHVHSIEGITNTYVPKCDECISISNSVKKVLESQYNIVSKVLFNGVDFSKFKKKESESISNKIVCIGSLNTKFKNQDGIIYEFYKIRDKIKADLHIIGNGADFKMLEDLINTLQLKNRVFLLGNKSQSWIQKNLYSYDLFLQGSHSEGLGIAAIEASACAIPLLLSNIDAHIEISNNGKLCDLYDSNKEDELGSKLIKFYKNPTPIFSHAKKSYLTQKSRFNFDLYNKKIINLYNR